MGDLLLIFIHVFKQCVILPDIQSETFPLQRCFLTPRRVWASFLPLFSMNDSVPGKPHAHPPMGVDWAQQTAVLRIKKGTLYMKGMWCENSHQGISRWNSVIRAVNLRNRSRICVEIGCSYFVWKGGATGCRPGYNRIACRTYRLPIRGSSRTGTPK